MRVAHTSDSAAQTGRADVQAELTARRRMGGEKGERGGAGQRDRGSTEKSRGRTQGAGEQRGARTRNKKKQQQDRRTHRKGTKRRQGAGGGGDRGPTGAQGNTMSHTEKHHAEDPHRAIPAVPPDHQGTDVGAAGGRGQRGSPPEGLSGEATQVGLQVGGQGRSPEAREGARDTTMARGRPAAGTRSRRTTLRGRAGDRGEGRVERRERGYMYINAGYKAGSPGMAGNRQGQRHRTAVGLDESTEGNRDRWRCSVVVRACREEGTTRK